MPENASGTNRPPLRQAARVKDWDALLKSPLAGEAQSIIVGAITEWGITYGGLRTKGLTRDELRRKAIEIFLRNKNKRVLISIDHSDALTLYADTFVREQHFELAVVMQATWLEHVLNKIVVVYGTRRKLSREEIVQMIREANFRAKVGWVFRLLRAPSIPSEHLKVMNRLAEARNEFVHYKWKGRAFGEDDCHYEEILSEFVATRRFMERYVRKYLHKNYKREKGSRATAPYSSPQSAS
jgi:hypothetical protein